MATPPIERPLQAVVWVPNARNPSAPTADELLAGTVIDPAEIVLIMYDGMVMGRPVRFQDRPARIVADGLGQAVIDFMASRVGGEADRPSSSEPPQRRDVTDEETGTIETMWVLADGSPTDFGPVEWSLRRDLAQIQAKGQLSGTLIASATALAQAMDRAQPDKIAGIGRELREHIRRIEDQAGDDNDTRDHRVSLSSPV